MLALILALAIAEPAPAAAATSAPAAEPEAAVIQSAANRARTPPNRFVCKWRVHTSGIPIRFCGTVRDWRDEKINHQQDIEIGQRRLLVSAPY